MEAMVHQSAALPAEVFGLVDRGVLKQGMYADIIVFDTATVKDQSTYIQPVLMATGMRYVFVNGAAAVDDGKPTNVLKGRALHAHQK
jgi:N-acyl-D-aspartate/D-glutamate deacylase